MAAYGGRVASDQSAEIVEIEEGLLIVDRLRGHLCLDITEGAPRLRLTYLTP